PPLPSLSSSQQREGQGSSTSHPLVLLRTFHFLLAQLHLSFFPAAYTLYCQKHWDTPPNHVIQVFQSPPWPQVYTIKSLGMQTVPKNIYEKMGRSQELSDSKRGPVIGGHLCNKSIRDISWLLNIPRSTVSGI
ncbi:unnamed protein product, partial [Staurois parvus]